MVGIRLMQEHLGRWRVLKAGLWSKQFQVVSLSSELPQGYNLTPPEARRDPCGKKPWSWDSPAPCKAAGLRPVGDQAPTASDQVASAVAHMALSGPWSQAPLFLTLWPRLLLPGALAGGNDNEVTSDSAAYGS